MKWIVLALLVAAPRTACPKNPFGILDKRVAHCDLMELNHVYGQDGEHDFDQVIFYRWSPDYRRHDILEWWLVDGEVKIDKRKKLAEKMLSHNRVGAGSTARYVVVSSLFIETTTIVDRERYQKRFVPTDQRGRLNFYWRK